MDKEVVRFLPMFGFDLFGFLQKVAKFGVRFVRLILWKNCVKACVEICGKMCEKVSTVWPKLKFYTQNSGNLHIYASFVESFPRGFAHWFISVKAVVLHIFHRVYYYNY